MLASKKGFTLIEVIIAIGILMILFAIAIPSYIAFTQTQTETNNVEIVQQQTTDEKQSEQKAVEPEESQKQKEEPQATEKIEGGDLKKL